MRIRRRTPFGPSGAPAPCQHGTPPSLPLSPSVDHHHATTGTMSSASQPKSPSPEGETFDSPQAPELRPLSSHLDGVPSNSEPDPSPQLDGEALPQGRELVLVAADVPMDAPALEAVPLAERPPRRASRRWAEWTPPEGLQMIVRERKSGRSKGNKDTYYTLPGVRTKFRSIPEVQRYLKQKPVRIWKKKSEAWPSQPTEAGSSSTPSDPQPAVELSPEEPKGEIKDEGQAE